LLAWLQTLPEFAVEADIRLERGAAYGGLQRLAVTANFTGSIRLLMGFRDADRLLHPRVDEPEEHDGGEGDQPRSFPLVEIVSLFPPRSTSSSSSTAAGWTCSTSVVLLGFYVMYMFLLLRMPPRRRRVDRRAAVPGPGGAPPRQARARDRRGLHLHRRRRHSLPLRPPFVNSLQSLAALVASPGYFFIQWIAPFMSEFPEKVSAYGWAMKEARPRWAS